MNINIRKLIISFSILILLTGIGFYVKVKMAGRKKPPIQRRKDKNGKRDVLAIPVQYQDNNITVCM